MPGDSARGVSSSVPIVAEISEVVEEQAFIQTVDATLCREDVGSTMNSKNIHENGFHPRETKSRRLNIMVAGQSGVGKTTLLRALVYGMCRHYKQLNQWQAFLQREGAEVTKTKAGKPHEIARLTFKWSKATSFIVTIIDSCGYGDDLDETKTFLPLQEYIHGKFKEWKESQDISRTPILQSNDPRVHCLLYFLLPTRFRKNDEVHMKNLCEYVPIVPVISKADTLSVPEVNSLLLRGKYTCEEVKMIGENGKLPEKRMGQCSTLNPGVIQALESACIPIFQFNKEDEPFSTALLNGMYGFKAVVSDIYAICANDKFDDDGYPIGRQYPWGAVDIKNPYHSDFYRLEKMLFRNGNQGIVRLLEETEDLYVKWRYDRSLPKEKSVTLTCKPTWFRCNCIVFTLLCTLWFFSLLNPGAFNQLVDNVTMSTMKNDNMTMDTLKTKKETTSDITREVKGTPGDESKPQKQEFNANVVCWEYNDSNHCISIEEDSSTVSLDKKEYEFLRTKTIELETSLRLSREKEKHLDEEARKKEITLDQLRRQAEEACQKSRGSENSFSKETGMYAWTLVENFRKSLLNFIQSFVQSEGVSFWREKISAGLS